MLMAKDIIRMEESLIHDAEPRKRSDTLPDGDMSSGRFSDWNPALASRRTSVPMEIIIGENGKPIFNATGSPIIPSERRTAHKKGAEPRNGKKKRASSVQKKKTVVVDGGSASNNNKMLKKKERQQSPEEQLSQSLATCSIGAPPRPSKNIEHLPEYAFRRPEAVVTVRDAVIQTDLF